MSAYLKDKGSRLHRPLLPLRQTKCYHIPDEGNRIVSCIL